MVAPLIIRRDVARREMAGGRREREEAIARIIAREQGIIKVAGLRHDWPVSPISVEGIDERTTMRRQGALRSFEIYRSQRISRGSLVRRFSGNLANSRNEGKQL